MPKSSIVPKKIDQSYFYTSQVSEHVINSNWLNLKSKNHLLNTK